MRVLHSQAEGYKGGFRISVTSMSNVFDFSSDEDASHNQKAPAKKIKLNDQPSKTTTNNAVKRGITLHKDDHENSSHISYIFSPYYTRVCSQLPIDKGRVELNYSVVDYLECNGSFIDKIIWFIG